ncbi:MAG: AI-2E family transporter [Olsenella sp.]|nr:AI-2E family transporter [Olsenella sp.]
MDKQDNKGALSIGWPTCVKLVISVLAVFLFIRYWGAVENFVGALLAGTLAIFAGLVIAYVVNIPMRFFERLLPGPKGDNTANRGISLLLSFLCAFLILIFVGVLVIPNLVGAIIKLAQAAPSVVESLTNNEFLASVLPPELLAQLNSIDWEKTVGEVTNWLQSGVSSSLPQVASVFGQIGAWLMGMIFALWFLGEKNGLSSGVHKLVQTYIGKRADEKFSRALAFADASFHSYVVGAGLEGLIFGGLVLIACAIAGMPEALMLGALVGVMSLIPMVGAIIGAVLGALIIFATSWQRALIFLVLFFVVQQIEQNFVYPRVVAKSVGLTGMWPLVGITIGTTVFGFAGAFIGVPLTATIFRIVEADFERREQLPDGGQSTVERIRKKLSD